jgi:FkbM family methyltransferase
MLTTAFAGIANFGKALNHISNSNFPRPIRAEIRRSVIRLISSRFVTLGNPTTLAGFQVSYFRAPELRFLFREIFADGSYFFHADNDRPFILDCGSNIGMSVLFFKKIYPNARIVGFEPDPATFKKLTENVEQNHLHDVALHQCALSDKEGTIEFFHKQGSLVMSTLKERIDGQQIVVPARRLSTFITDSVDLLKMDIEGAEEVVLPELAASGKLGLIKQMHIEYHHHIVGDADRMSSILKLLEDAGFGYQLAAPAKPGKSPAPQSFQDIAIYCYRKIGDTVSRI